MGDNSHPSRDEGMLADMTKNVAATGDDEEKEKVVNVLITGFGPFKAQYPINPSWEIARSLPRTMRLPPTPDAPRGTRVNLRVYPAPVRVSYAVVDALVPGFWDVTKGGRKMEAGGVDGEGDEGGEGREGGEREDDEEEWRADWGVHIGMAAGREFYSIERRAAAGGYRVGDVDGCLPSTQGREDEVLEVGIDVDALFLEWKRRVGERERESRTEGAGEGDWKGKDVDLRVSDDAGRYLCEYTLHASLEHLKGGEREGKCLFLHVPAPVGEREVRAGGDVVLGLVEAVVVGGWWDGKGEEGEGERVKLKGIEEVKGFVGGGSVRVGVRE